MELRRDTDYALRIVMLFAENLTTTKSNGFVADLSLWDIAVKTGVPRSKVKRLCEALMNKGWIRCVDGPEMNPKYVPADCINQKSLFDVIELFEGTADLFFAFDKRQGQYGRFSEVYGQLECEIADTLKNAKIVKLLDLGKEV